MKVWITHSDGRYFCHPWEGGDPTGIPVVEVPWYRMLQIKVTRWLDRKTNAYLIKLDNAWWDTQDR